MSMSGLGSRRSVSGLGAAIVVILVAGLIAAAAQSGAGTETGPAPASQQASSPATAPAEATPLPDLTAIMKQVEGYRGLEFKKDVPAKTQSQEDWIKYLRQQLNSAFPPDRREAMKAGLSRLGMLTGPVDLEEELMGAFQSQAGAYYDPETGTFYYLMSDLPEALLQTMASHELVHALQDQYFDLAAFLERLEKEYTGDVRNDDRILACRSLVEGEATYVQFLWQIKSMLGMDLSANPDMEAMQFRMMADMDLKQLVEMTKQTQVPMFEGEENPLAEAMAQMDKIPPYILHPLYAAYMKGAYFIMRLRHHGGWEAVSDAYESVPATAEQVLHPEKFLDERDEPTTLVLPAFEALNPEQWTPIDSAIHGEFYLGLLLRNFNRSGSEAAQAAAGWDGDVYRAYRDRDGRILIAMLTTWDTEVDAIEFFNAYRAMLPQKYTLAEERLEPDPGDGETPRELAFQCADPDLGHGLLVRRGREVMLVEGGSADLARRLVTEMAAIEIEHRQ